MKTISLNIVVRAETGLKAGGRERTWIKSLEKSFDRDKWAVDLSLRLRIKRKVLKSGGPLIEWRSVSRGRSEADRDWVTGAGLMPNNVCLKYKRRHRLAALASLVKTERTKKHETCPVTAVVRSIHNAFAFYCCWWERLHSFLLGTTASRSLEHIVGLVGCRIVEHHFTKITFSSTTEDNNYYPPACNTSPEI